MLAKEADICCRHNNTLCAIANNFAIDLDILTVRVASWDGTDNAMMLLAMKQCEDNAQVQHFFNDCAAVAVRARWKAAMRASVLAASRCQKDQAHTQAFASTTAKRGHQETTLRTALTWYEKSLPSTTPGLWLTMP